MRAGKTARGEAGKELVQGYLTPRAVARWTCQHARLARCLRENKGIGGTSETGRNVVTRKRSERIFVWCRVRLRENPFTFFSFYNAPIRINGIELALERADDGNE